jgi:adenosylhomocysteine nucleosidase
MIGLIAVRSEATTLLKLISLETTTEQIQTHFYRGQLAGRPVILATVGPGKVQTAAVTQHLIDQYQVDLLMSCGSAGALDPHLQIGDVVLAEKVTLHDVGLHINNGFQHLGIYDNTHPDGLHYHRALAADPDLLSTARQAAMTVTWPKTRPKIKTGGLVSGDQAIADETKRQWLRHTFQALAVDMESGAMAQVAFLNDVPWLVVRAVSDNADSTIDFDLPRFITYSDEASTRLARLQQAMQKIVTLARKPARLKTALNARRARQCASANAAQVTMAIIAQFE